MKLLPVILVCVLAIGCELIGEKDDALLSGEVENQVMKVEYTPEENRQILDAFVAYQTFNAKWSDIADDSVTAIITGDVQLYDDYEVLKKHYLIVEALVTEKWDQYDAATQAELRQYQKDAYKVNDRMERNKKISTALEYSDVVLGVLLKML